MKKLITMLGLGAVLSIGAAYKLNKGNYPEENIKKCEAVLKNLPEAPKGLPDLEIYKSGWKWESFLKEKLDNFMFAPKAYSNVEPYLHIGYGLMSYPDHTTARVIDENKSFVAEVINKIYASKTQELIFNWAMPKVKEAFFALPEKNQEIYVRILDYTKKYLENFDYNKELTYLNNLRKENKEGNFTGKDPDGKYNDYRKIDAFVFRRVNNRDLTAKEMLDWTNKIEEYLLRENPNYFKELKSKYDLTELIKFNQQNKKVYEDFGNLIKEKGKKAEWDSTDFTYNFKDYTFRRYLLNWNGADNSGPDYIRGYKSDNSFSFSDARIDGLMNSYDDDYKNFDSAPGKEKLEIAKEHTELLKNIMRQEKYKNY